MLHYRLSDGLVELEMVTCSVVVGFYDYCAFSHWSSECSPAYTQFCEYDQTCYYFFENDEF